MSMEELQVGAGTPKQVNPTQARPGPARVQQGQQSVPDGVVNVNMAQMIGEQAIQIRGMEQEIQRLNSVVKVVESDRNAHAKRGQDLTAQVADMTAEVARLSAETEKLKGYPVEPPMPDDLLEKMVGFREASTRAAIAMDRATDAKAAKP